MKKTLTGLLLIGNICFFAQVNLSSSLTACYSLNGNANDPINNLTGTLSAVTSTVDRLNNANSAYYFSGSASSYIALPNSSLIKANAVSFSCWVKTDLLATQYLVFANNGCASFYEGYAFAIHNPGNGYRFHLVKSNNCLGSTQVSLNGTTLVSPQTWYHVGFYVGPDSLKIYVNGNLESSLAYASALSYAATNVFLGGTNVSNNAPFFGTMDNARFYNRKLNSAEMYQLYTQDPSCNQTPNSSFSVSPASICAGDVVTLTDLSSGSPTSWDWQTPGANSPSTSVNNPTVSFPGPGTYTVSLTGSNGNGQGTTATKTLVVLATPTIAISSGTLFCSGQSATLAASGASTYTWSSSQTSSLITISPTQNITYTVTGSTNGCASSVQKSIIVSSSPSLTISGTNTLCAGASTTLQLSGTALSYTWNAGATSSTLPVSPLASTLYSVTGTGANGCKNTATYNVVVNALPVISVSGNGSVCLGSPLSFSASSTAITYTWNNGMNGSSITVTPALSFVYTVTGTDANGCLNSSSFPVTVMPDPTVTIASNIASCAGKSITIVASGALTYTWSNNQAGASIVSYPLTNTIYTVTGTDINGCVNSASTGIAVLANPTLTIPTAVFLCAGETYTLSVSGASTYVWNTNQAGSSIVIAPSTHTTYSVSGMAANGCSASASSTVTVNPLPILSISGSGTVCQGLPTTLLAGGSAINYTWSTGSHGNLITVIPSVSTIYTVSGADINGCVNTATQLVFVNSLPPVSANIANNTICSGDPAVLYGGGAVSYLWTGGISDNITFYPNTTAGYTVTGTGSNGCKNTASVQVIVNALPVLSHSTSAATPLCPGEPVILSASGANIYSWSTGAVTASVLLMPLTNSQYTVTGTDANGCRASFVFVQNVNACLGLKNNLIESNFEVYPNPTTGEIFVKNPKPELSYEVFNVLGSSVLKGNLNATDKFKIDLEAFPNGVYFLKYKDGSSFRSIKIVKE